MLYDASKQLQRDILFMCDETQLRIIDATMTLIIEKGYSGATSKNIAKLAGVNESTIFRRFDGKKEIVLAAMELAKWNPYIIGRIRAWIFPNTYHICAMKNDLIV